MEQKIERPEHPLAKWLALNPQVTVDNLVTKCRKLGRKTKAVYIHQIMSGYYRPSWPFAKILSVATGASVSVTELLEYPYLYVKKAA